jgi:hypothetical protein
MNNQKGLNKLKLREKGAADISVAKKTSEAKKMKSHN